jgi:hypothetical protein
MLYFPNFHLQKWFPNNVSPSLMRWWRIFQNSRSHLWLTHYLSINFWEKKFGKYSTSHFKLLEQKSNSVLIFVIYHFFYDEKPLQGKATLCTRPYQVNKPWIHVKRPFHTDQVIFRFHRRAGTKELFVIYHSIMYY